MSVLDIIRARRARAAASAPAPVASVASCCNGFATPCNAPKSLIYKDLSGRVATVASVARKIDEVGREAQTQPTPSMREAHEAYLLHHWHCRTCCAAGQRYGSRCAEGARLWSAYNEAAQRECADREAAKRQRPAFAPEAPILTPEQRRRLWWGQPASAEELVRMAERAQRGESLGLSAREAEALADLLRARDREDDDRHLCVECQHVRAAADGWRCAALQGPIPREWVTVQPQRCPMLKGVERD